MRRDRASARVRANRANAQLSTGPKTAAGKGRSARNATLFGLRVGVGDDDGRVAQLAAAIAGPGATAAATALAADVAQAHLDALLARRLGAAAWGVFRDGLRTPRGGVDAPDEPVTSEAPHPGGRPSIRGDHPAERRLVAKIDAYARKLRDRSSADLMRRIKVLQRYEGRALARLRRASAAYQAAVGAPQDAAFTTEVK